MQEHSQNFEEVKGEPEVTLAAPRFDADEARRAHPVVPLTEVRAARTRFRPGARRNWLLSLLAVALLAFVTLGGVLALRRAHMKPPADASQDAQPTRTDAAPQQPSPAQPFNSLPQTDASAAQGDAQPQTTSAPNAAGEEKTDEQQAEGRAAAARAREPRALHARHAEALLPPPQTARGEADGEDFGRRGHFKDRDGHDADRDAKEASKASKHSKKGEARLVDVIVGRPRP
jgi:hypothetical protein